MTLTTHSVGRRSSCSIDRLGLNKKRAAPGRRVETVYDDTDFSYSNNRKAVKNSRDRKQQSKQFGKDGKRLAPWMVSTRARACNPARALGGLWLMRVLLLADSRRCLLRAQVIDEKRVDKVREQRRENKRKTGSFFGR